MPDPAALLAIDDLQMRHAHALDRRDMAAWLACFDTERGSYECITDESVRQDLPLPIMLDDTPARLRDRVRFVTEIWVGTFEDYATRHFVQRLTCEALASDAFSVTTNVLVAYTSPRGQSEMLTAGRYEDVVRLGDGTARFERKRAILDTVTTPRYLVYPV